MAKNVRHYLPGESELGAMNNPDDNRAAHAGELAPINRSLSALVLVLAVAGRSVAGGFFNGPPATPGDPMFFSIYSILKVQKGNLNLQKISDGGFTSAGPHYGAGNGGDPINNSTVYYSRVADAAEEGLGMIAHIAWHPGVVNDTNGNIRPNSMAAISEASVRACATSDGLHAQRSAGECDDQQMVFAA